MFRGTHRPCCLGWSISKAVIPKDAGKRGSENGAYSELHQTPYGVFAAGAAPEVWSDHQKAWLPIRFPIQHEVRAFSARFIEAQIVKYSTREVIAGNSFEELFRHNHIGIDVGLP